jgi:hypothetical protein
MRHLDPTTIAYLHTAIYIEGNKLFRRNLWADDHKIVSGVKYPTPNSMMPIRIPYATIAYVLHHTEAPDPLRAPTAKDYEPFPFPEGTRVRHLNCNTADFSKANLIKTSPKPQLSDRG